MNHLFVLIMKTICVMAIMITLDPAYSGDILKDLKCHDDVVKHGLATLNLARDVESMFASTNVDHYISGFGNQNQSPTWNSVAYFSGRYRLVLQVPIQIDYERCQLVGAKNSAIVQINEVIKVELSKSGIAEATMYGQWRLNENEWRWLVKNSGDWSVVKVPIQTNAPVAGFSGYVRQAREPIRNRKEGFDKRIEKALDELGRMPASIRDEKHK